MDQEQIQARNEKMTPHHYRGGVVEEPSNQNTVIASKTELGAAMKQLYTLWPVSVTRTSVLL